MSLNVKMPAGTPDIRIGSVRIAVPQRAATGSIGSDTSTGAVYLSGVKVDQREPFEVVLCFYAKNEWLTNTKMLICGAYDTDSFYVAVDTQGKVYFQFFWGAHDWSPSSDHVAIFDDGTHIICDGATPNFIKAEKTSDNKLKLSHSTDGITYTVIAETTLPSSMPNLRTAGDLYIGCYGSGSGFSQYRYIEHINIFNCCFKQNGNVLWGREIG